MSVPSGTVYVKAYAIIYRYRAYYPLIFRQICIYSAGTKHSSA